MDGRREEDCVCKATVRAGVEEGGQCGVAGEEALLQEHGADVDFVLSGHVTRGWNNLADVMFNYEGLIVMASD